MSANEDLRKVLTDRFKEVAYGKNILDRFIRHLSEKKVKKDDTTKRIMFLTDLSAFTDDPLNTFLKGISSIGKTYVAMSCVSYFPEDRVMLLGGLSPTAMVHDFGDLVDGTTGEIYDPIDSKPDKNDHRDSEGKLDRAAFKEASREFRDKLKRSYYRVDLMGKILVFLEPPHPDTYTKLRPILSHDAWEISYKFTDRPGGGCLRTMHVKIRGWPATIFCTTEEKYIEELATRSFTHTPEMSSDKYKAAIELQGDKAAFPWRYREDEELRKLKGYLETLLAAVGLGFKVVMPYGRELAKNYEAALPRDMRDHPHLHSLIKASAILNLFQRPQLEVDGERWILANIHDLREALKVFSQVELTTRSGLPGHIVAFFEKTLLPLWEKNEKMPLRYGELVLEHNEKNEQQITTKTVSGYINVLRDVRWVDTESDEADKRFKLVRLIRNPVNTPKYSDGIIHSLFKVEGLRNWFEGVKKYSSEKTQLRKNYHASPEPVENDLIETLFSTEYYLPTEIEGKPETEEEKAVIIPTEGSGTSPSESAQDSGYTEDLPPLPEETSTPKIGGTKAGATKRCNECGTILKEEYFTDPQTGNYYCESHRPHSKVPLQERVEWVHKIVSHHQKLTGIAKHDTVLATLQQDHGIDREEALKLIGILQRDGRVFEPRPGYYKTTGGS